MTGVQTCALPICLGHLGVEVVVATQRLDRPLETGLHLGLVDLEAPAALAQLVELLLGGHTATAQPLELALP